MGKHVIYVRATDLCTLEDLVNRAVADGYVPYGQPVPYEFGTPGTLGHDYGFSQTMIECPGVPLTQVLFNK